MKLTADRSRRAYLVVLPMTYVRRAGIAALVVLIAVIPVLLVVAPPLLGLAFAVVLAAPWCIWLEHHPGPKDRA
jgi:hypothetical protein